MHTHVKCNVDHTKKKSDKTKNVINSDKDISLCIYIREEKEGMGKGKQFRIFIYFLFIPIVYINRVG